MAVTPADTIREALTIIRHHRFDLLVIGAIRILLGRDAAKSYLDRKQT